MFSIPSYADEDLAKRCGFMDIPNISEQRARISILIKLRAIEKATDNISNHVYTRALSLYETFRSPDPKRWAQLTTSTAARSVDPSPSIPLPTIFATHNFLMHNSVHFVAHPTSHRFIHTFLVRPKAKVDILERVTAWTRDPSNGIVDKFIEKATRAMAENKQLENGHYDANPSVVHPRKADDLTLDDNDRTIVSFLCDSFQSTRAIQDNPYMIPTAHLLKRLGEPPGPAGSSMSLQRVLTAMGVFTPWADIPTISSDIFTLSNQVSGKPPTISPSMNRQPLGPDDLYPTDLLESVRHDFGDMPVYVIDDATAEELDDGLSIESIATDPDRVWVHIHVADPTRLLPPTHKFAIQARQVSESMYFNHGTRPMLPPDSIFSTLSLGEASARGKPEYVMTFSAKIDKAGDIIDYKVRAGIVRNIKTLTYGEVDRLLDVHTLPSTYPFLSNHPTTPQKRVTSKLDPSDIEKLRSLLQVSQQLVDNRKRLPIFSFTLPSADVSLVPKHLPPCPSPNTMDRFQLFSGFPSMTYTVIQGDNTSSGARMLVTELMKACARVASRFGVDRGIPLIRRVSGQIIIPDPNDFPKLLAARDHAGSIDPLAAFRAQVIIPRVVNTIQPKGHWTMGIPDGEGYVRTTSPLRRYADLIAHWQIKHALLNSASGSSASLISEEWMSEFANELTMKGREIKRLDSQHNSYWAAVYLNQWLQGRVTADIDPSQTFIARIASMPAMDPVTSLWVIRVLLPELGMFAQLYERTEWEIGSEHRVRITSVGLSINPVVLVTRV
jgi:exoribonuclease II